MPGGRALKRTNQRAALSTPKIKRRRESVASKEQNDISDSSEDTWLLRWEDERGTLLVAGQGEVGQLGLGEDITDRKKFVPLPALGAKIVAIAAGGMHSAALDEDGTVWTFGCNDEGALGRLTSGQEEESVPAKVDLPSRCVALSAGDSHTAAVLDDGRLMAWGSFRDSHGSMGLQLMNSDTGHKCDTPIELTLPHGVTDIASGADHILALTNKRNIYTLGCAEQGQLGRMPARSASRNARNRLGVLLSPLPVALPKADSKRGSRLSTPVNASSSDVSSSMPRDTQSTTNSQRQVTVWAGSHSSFLRSADGNIYAWGLNNYSQLGIPMSESDTVIYKPKLSAGFNEPPLELVSINGEETTRPLPNRVQWTHIACGLHHSVALDSEGRVYSVGRREYGRLGLGGRSDDALRPTLVPLLKGVRCVTVAASTSTSFAVSQEGGVFSWGMGNGYALGTGEEDDCLEPVRVFSRNLTVETKALKVSAGGQHSLVLVKGAPVTQPVQTQPAPVAVIKTNGNGTGNSTESDASP